MTEALPAPVLSYRLQLAADLGFDQVTELLDHLVALGVSHPYLSPVTEAVPGSGHGYDVVDHTTVRAELGGADGLDRLFAAADRLGLSVVIDHVPNHASTARPESNRPWWERLRTGPSGAGGPWFDVDPDVADGRVVLPVLGAPLDEVLADGDVRVVSDDPAIGEPHLLVHGGLRLPLAPDAVAPSPGVATRELLDRQWYVLVHWREPIRNVRRFFTIDDLVAVRVEEDGVAEAVDTLPAGWAGRPGFGGLRIDHVDGLADPERYLRDLRGRIGDAAWLVVEKILAPDEVLVASWPVDGTTGYEFARVLDQLMVDPAAAPTFDRLWGDAVAVGGEAGRGTFHDVEDRARREVLEGGLAPDLDRVVRAARRALDLPDEMPDGRPDHGVRLDDLRRVVVELTARLPRYRTYLPDDPAASQVLDSLVPAVTAELSDLTDLVDRVVALLRHPGSPAAAEFRTRWQQLTGPAMAKGAEDRAFYRWLRFSALCEVGGEPGSFGIGLADFHAAQDRTQRDHPRTMLAASTHDTKRSADVRARAAALSAEHEAWAVVSQVWSERILAGVAGLDPVTVSHALQTVVTCPGLDADRLTAFLVKSAREAEVFTSWTSPDDRHEECLRSLSETLVGTGDLATEIAQWSECLDRPGRAAAIAATLIRLTAPGVPDLYQGDEGFAYRLVDPDNRVPPEWDLVRRTVSTAGSVDAPTAWRSDPECSKAVVIRRATAVRRRFPDAFGPRGTYEPLTVSGPGAGRVLAFGRGRRVLTVAPLPGLELGPDLVLDLPAGRWRDELVDDAPAVSGRLPLAEVFERFPGGLFTAG